MPIGSLPSGLSSSSPSRSLSSSERMVPRQPISAPADGPHRSPSVSTSGALVDTLADGRLTSSQAVLVRPAGMSAHHRPPAIVPLQADFKPRVAPHSQMMNAIAAHVDDCCQIYVHELQDGRWSFVESDCMCALSPDFALHSRHEGHHLTPNLKWKCITSEPMQYRPAMCRLQNLLSDSGEIFCHWGMSCFS